jgi:uncharacterized protein (TIGR02217 family)
MAFLETPRFPDDIAYGSTGGPTYKTSVVVLASGREKRNITWSQARHEYDVSYGIRNQTQLNGMVEFFHAVRGRGHSFRYKDFADFHTATPSSYGAGGDPATPVTKDDENFGTGDTIETVFQLTKTYASGALNTVRDITKPISGTVLIALAGVLQTEGGGSDYTIDYTTGLVTFISAPGGAVAITWGGQFDVPCRFDKDSMSTELEMYTVGNISTPLVEVRL